MKIFNVFRDYSGWYVADMARNVLAGPFDTNAQAWRWVDKANNEAHNAKEARHDWAAQQYLRS